MDGTGLRGRMTVGCWAGIAAAGAAVLTGCGGDSRSAPLLPEVADLGGPHMTHPQLVPIFFANEPDFNANATTLFSQWIGTSAWLAAVGSEYGVGIGSMIAAVTLAEPEPTAITDREIVDLLFAHIADGTLPPPMTDALYMLYFSSNIPITTGFGTSCVDFGAYHSAARRNGIELSYAVMANCSDLPGDDRDILASHELIEAATDPFPDGHPGFRLKDPTSSWRALGDEVADLCERGDSTDVYTEGMFSAQLSWSAQAAASGHGNPCVPSRPLQPYYNVTSDLDRIPRIAPGGHQTIQLRGWASGLADGFFWQLQAQPSRTGALTFALGAASMSAGQTTTLDIRVPADAAPGALLRFYVYSAVDSETSYQVLPGFVMVGDPCSSFTSCIACSAQTGCGFCATTGKCEAESESGSAESSCPASSFATWPGSCDGFCAGHGASCGACTSLPGCGWCDTGSGPQCMEARHEGGGAESGSCAYADWSALSSYCPK